jgi:hypothetical protein
MFFKIPEKVIKRQFFEFRVINVIGRCGPATKWNPEEFGLGGQLIFVF